MFDINLIFLLFPRFSQSYGEARSFFASSDIGPSLILGLSMTKEMIEGEDKGVKVVGEGPLTRPYFFLYRTPHLPPDV